MSTVLMKILTSRLVFSLALFPALTGCVMYRLVDRSDAGATYALYTPDRQVPDDLRKEVDQNCGGPARLVHEGEVPVGEVSQTQAAQSRQGNLTFGTATTNTSQKVEWRVTFVCGPNVTTTPAPTTTPTDAPGQPPVAH